MVVKKTGKFLYYDVVGEILSEYNNKPYFSSIKSERELCEQFNVSRPTIRKALDILAQEKKILKIPGKGAVYIGREVLVQSDGSDSQSNISFFNNATMHGNYVKDKVLFQNIIKADQEISFRLNIRENEKVFNLQRLRKLDSDVCSLESSYIPYSICPQLIHVDFGNTPLHKTLEGFGVHVYRARRVVEIVNANANDALQLGVLEGEKIVMIQTTCYDDSNNILEYVLAKTPTDKIRFEFNAVNK